MPFINIRCKFVAFKNEITFWHLICRPIHKQWTFWSLIASSPHSFDYKSLASRKCFSIYCGFWCIILPKGFRHTNQNPLINEFPYDEPRCRILIMILVIGNDLDKRITQNGWKLFGRSFNREIYSFRQRTLKNEFNKPK